MLPFLLPILGAAANAVGGAVGGAAAGGDRAQQRRLLERILADADAIDIPTLERIAGERLGPSAFEDVQVDPRLQTEQLDTLNRLSDFADDGDTAETRAAMNRILSDVARQESAGRNQILHNMRSRGVSGSGAELAMQLDNQQNAADRAQTAGLDQAAQAQRRMLEAVMNKGRMAGDIRGQDYREKSDAARARDMISQYNADSASRAKYYNASLPQQQYQMQMQKLNAQAGAAGGASQAAGAAADRTAAMGAGVGAGIGQAASAFGSDLQRKKDREDDRAFYERMWGAK